MKINSTTINLALVAAIGVGVWIFWDKIAALWNGSGVQKALDTVTNAIGDTVANVSETLAYGSDFTPTTAEEVAIAQQYGWMDSQGNLTASGKAAITSGQWKQIMAGVISSNG